ncbi:hypothetical protein QZM42_05415 [Burkholderia vietnamiensis]|uniref:hypothetical protein n=1 Tax=Burkholderia vietnamiensis TaxID=60552 RepID=UPI00264C99B9|nr:hypothetical protein [Burkholderia vietnamiensis]MDN7407983.1 hypothetical protein [Burkholderia vietnamiensis]
MKLDSGSFDETAVASMRQTYFEAAEMLPRSTVILLATRCHLALNAMRSTRGSASTAKTLLEVTFVANLLTERGYGRLDEDAVRDSETAIRAAILTGVQHDCWDIQEADFPAVSRVVEAFEEQLESAPAADVERAFQLAKAVTGL